MHSAYPGRSRFSTFEWLLLATRIIRIVQTFHTNWSTLAETLTLFRPVNKVIADRIYTTSPQGKDYNEALNWYNYSLSMFSSKETNKKNIGKLQVGFRIQCWLILNVSFSHTGYSIQ